MFSSKGIGLILLVVIGYFGFTEYQKEKKGNSVSFVDSHYVEAQDLNKEQKYKLTIALNGINDTLGYCTENISWRLYNIDSFKNLLSNTKYQIELDSIQQSNYISNHKAAILSIIAGKAGVKEKLDFENEYPEIVDEAASWGIAYSFLYYMFNSEEVEQVKCKFSEYKDNKERLYQNLQIYESSLNEESTILSNVYKTQSDCIQRRLSIQEQIQKLGGSGLKDAKSLPPIHFS